MSDFQDFQGFDESPRIPGVSLSPYQSPMYNHGGSILILTDPEDELYKMELTLRSMRLDQKGQPVVAGEPLLNELGVGSVLGQVQSIVNQVTVMSNLSEAEVRLLIDFLGDTLAKDLMLNRVKYDIRNAASRDKIYFTALTSGFICMKRAFEEGDRRFWKGSQQEVTFRNEAGNQPTGGWFSKLVGWGGK